MTCTGRYILDENTTQTVAQSTETLCVENEAGEGGFWAPRVSWVQVETVGGAEPQGIFTVTIL